MLQKNNNKVVWKVVYHSVHERQIKKNIEYVNKPLYPIYRNFHVGIMEIKNKTKQNKNKNTKKKKERKEKSIIEQENK